MLLRSWPVVRLLVALQDSGAGVRRAGRSALVSEQPLGAAVDDADAAVHVADHDRALHRLQDLRRRRTRGVMSGELETPDRGGGDDDEGERGDVADRLQIDADGREVVEHADRAEDERQQQCAGALPGRPFGAAIASARRCGWRR